MEAAELEYRLLKDKCTSVIAEIKCGKQLIISSEEQAGASLNASGTVNDLRNNYLFTAPDYLSVLDYLACNL